MSSYVSGVYDIVADIADAIRTQAMRELRVAQQELREINDTISINEKSHNAMLSERQQREDLRKQSERRMDEEIADQRQKSDAVRLARNEEAMALLSTAKEQLSFFDDEMPEKVSLLEKIGCYESSIAMFGITEETVKSIQNLTRITIPNLIAESYQRQETARLEQMTHDHLQVRGTVVDKGLPFVSLSVQKEQKKNEERPWDAFVKRVQTLTQQQQQYGVTGAEELMHCMEKLSPSERNKFMLKHRMLLQRWEKEAEGFANSINVVEKQRELYLAYSVLFEACKKTNVFAKLSPDVEYDQLQREYDRLCSEYVDQRKQQYIEKTFREVFEAHGLDFESMSTDTTQNIQIEFSMDEDCGVRVMRSASGAFDMVFFGVATESGVSLDQQRKVNETAHAFCKKLPSITEALQKRGIVFQQRLVTEPTEDTIAFEYKTTGTKKYETKRVNYLK